MSENNNNNTDPVKDAYSGRVKNLKDMNVDVADLPPEIKERMKSCYNELDKAITEILVKYWSDTHISPAMYNHMFAPIYTHFLGNIIQDFPIFIKYSTALHASEHLYALIDHIFDNLPEAFPKSQQENIH